MLRGRGGEEPFASWLPDFEIARDGPRFYCLDLICQAGARNWRAAAWLLEKLYPHEFGALLGTPAPVKAGRKDYDLSKLTTEELWELRRLQEKMRIASGDERGR